MIFEVRDGGFGYSSHECILKNVNFSLDEPQVLSVLGANGAGKTTLLKCMLGLLEWNTGGTFVDGVNIKDIPYNQLWQKIGYVPQAKASAFAYSTQEMVILGRNAHLGTFRQPKKRDWEIAEACMEEIGIGYLKGKLCSHISGGELQMGTSLQKQHFVIIRNVHQIPKVLFRFFNDGLKGFRSMAHLHH